MRPLVINDNLAGGGKVGVASVVMWGVCGFSGNLGKEWVWLQW